MFYLIYTSQSKNPWTEDSLRELLITSAHNNRQLDITGMLVFMKDRFIQVLEGSKLVVENLYQKIAKDPRHEKVTVLLEGNSSERIFKNWAMGFKLLKDEELENLTGYRDLSSFFKNDSITDESHPALIFLKLFYDRNLQDLIEN